MIDSTILSFSLASFLHVGIASLGYVLDPDDAHEHLQLPGMLVNFLLVRVYHPAHVLVARLPRESTGRAEVRGYGVPKRRHFFLALSLFQGQRQYAKHTETPSLKLSAIL